jgi:hypothetical protein
MATKIIRKPGMDLEVWIRDLGKFDAYRVFMNKIQVGLSFELEKHYEVPAGVTSVRVQFEGQDGGISAIVDVTAAPAVLAKQDQGKTHDYEIATEAGGNGG